MALSLRAPVRVAPQAPVRSRGVCVRAAAAEAVVAYEATGVPLVDELMQLTAREGLVQAAKLVAVAAVGAFIGSAVLKAIDERLSTDKFNVFTAALAATTAPGATLLPFYVLAYSTTVVSALTQVAATKFAPSWNAAMAGHGPQVLELVKQFTQLVQDTSELVVIVFVAWAAINFKDRVIAHIAEGLAGEDGLSRLLKPVGGMLTWVIGGIAGFAALAAYGVDITPLLASAGASSVVIGIASQDILKNIGSALTIYTSRPFINGDDVELLTSGGGLVAAGTVVAVEPMRTVLRTAEGEALFIANGVVAGLMVKNKSAKV